MNLRTVKGVYDLLLQSSLDTILSVVFRQESHKEHG